MSGGAITCFLGSFDPVHRGHLWLARYALQDSAAVHFLLPRVHFHKRIVSGENATLTEREALLALLPDDVRALSSVARTHEVLFLDLVAHLPNELGAPVRFALGDETFAKVMRSPEYYARVGRAFGPRERALLTCFRRSALVFARHAEGPGFVRLPPELAAVSSTRVRASAAELHAMCAPRAAWHRALDPLTLPDVTDALYDRQLYRRRAFSRDARPRSTLP